jgi:hypothetical protein
MSGFASFFKYLFGTDFQPSRKLKAEDLNILQDQISAGVKKRMTLQKYDHLLLLSKYDCAFIEDFTKDTFRQDSSSAEIENAYFLIRSGVWITSQLDVSSHDISSFCLIWHAKEPPGSTEKVKFFYRKNIFDPFEEIFCGQEVTLTSPWEVIQIKAQMPLGTGYELSDFAIFWR